MEPGTFPLPNELTDRVIDHLHDDRLSLKACSLVCQEWRCASQFQLYQHLSFSLRKAENYMYTMKSFWRSPPENAVHYLQHVRTLTLTNGRGHFSRLDLKCLSNLSKVLPNVQTLELSRTQWAISARDKEPIEPWTSVRTLKISCTPMVVCPAQSLITILQVLPNVEHLHFNTVPCYKLALLPCPENNEVVFPKLRSLTCHDLSNIGNLFLGLQPMLSGQLESLNVSGVYILNDLIHLNDFGHIRSTLRTLRLEINETPQIMTDQVEECEKSQTDERGENTSLNLNQYTALQHVTLIVRSNRYPAQVAILKQLPPSVRIIVFELFWSSMDGLDMKNCLDGLEEAEFLEAVGPLTHLEAVHFMPAIKGVEMKDAAQRVVRDKLPILSDKNLLRFHSFHTTLPV